MVASLEPRRNNFKHLMNKRNSKQAPRIKGLSFNRSSSSSGGSRSSSSSDRKLSSEYAGTMKVYHKKLEDTQYEGRWDRYGTLIISGSKDHKICFRDEVGEGNIEVVKEVECYKEYYKNKAFAAWTCTIM